MGTIRLLPDAAINMIAAGEVVERPASVVKELVENALDAGAGRIEVSIEGGGAAAIVVRDDGRGMNRDDALLCLERHSTSKIGGIDDLATVASLGFRGEALPSIASVSRLRIVTRCRDADEGTAVEVEGGRIVSVRAAGCSPGTEVSIRDLFYNTPARRKFLRGRATEQSHCAEAVIRLAIPFHDAAFSLSTDGRPLIEAGRAEPLGSRLHRLLGRDAAGSLVPVVAAADGLSLSGFVGSPAVARPGGGGPWIFVNRRFVRDRLLGHAVSEAYTGLIERGARPLAVLLLSIDPSEVDVNVHPAKLEVRFRDGRAVHRFVADRVAEVLAKEKFAGRDGLAQGVSEPLGQGWPTVATAVSGAGYSVGGGHGEGVGPAGSMPLPGLDQGAGPFSSMRPLGQLWLRFIVLESAAGLVLIDQHAAHERVVFQRLFERHRSGRAPGQPLLIPITIELDPADAIAIGGGLDRLAGLGVALEPFGSGGFVVRELPPMLDHAALPALLADLAVRLREFDDPGDLAAWAADAYSRIACHAVVRGRRGLTPDEIRALLRDLDEVDFSITCPHGRPVFFTLGSDEIERRFKRSI